MSHPKKGLAYFSEEEFINARMLTPGFEERKNLVVAEDEQLERRIKPEVIRGFRAFFRITDQLKNRMNDAESERQVFALTWSNAGIGYDGADSSLALSQLYGHLVGVEHVDKVLNTQARFSAIVPGYAVEFDERLLNEAAVRFLLARVPLTREEFDTLEAKYKSQAFVISRFTTARDIRRAQEDLSATLARGGTFADWRNNLDDVFAGLGIEPANSFYLDNVYRTNVLSAYNAGRWEQAQRRMDIISLYEYHAVLDARTRPAHRAMDGTKAPPDHQIWLEWYPPNGYKCRCRVVVITKYVARRYGLTEDPVMPAVKPDEGFDHSPVQGLPPSLLARAQEFGIPIR